MNIFTEGKQPTINDLLCKFVVCLGVRGSGKSNTASVLCEEFLESKVSLSIIDIEGEYWGIKENYDILIVGGAHADVELHPEHARILAKTVLEKGVSVILDLSDIKKEDCDVFLLNYFEELWSVGHALRKPHMVILEEADEFIPQGINSDLKEILTKIARRGRKWGLGAVIISQRSAKIEKNVITQAEVFFLHKVTFPTDFEVYGDLLNMTRKQVSEAITTVTSGEVFYKVADMIEKRKIRMQHTYHAGSTPTLDAIAKVPDLKKLSEDLLTAFRSITVKSTKEESVMDRLEKELEQKKAESLELQKRINNLEQQVEIASRLKVEVVLPTQQIIEQAVIKQLKAVGVEVKEASPVPITSEVAIVPAEPAPASTEDQIAEPYRKRVRMIEKLINSFDLLHLRILNFLESRSPNRYNVQQIAAWIGLSPSTITNHPPLKMVKMKILKRDRGDDNAYIYRSNFRNFLEDEFSIYRPILTDREFDIIYNCIITTIDQILKSRA